MIEISQNIICSLLESVAHKEREESVPYTLVWMPLISRRDLWQQGQLVEVVINDLSDTSDGVGRWGERVVFVPDSVPGDSPPRVEHFGCD